MPHHNSPVLPSTRSPHHCSTSPLHPTPPHPTNSPQSKPSNRDAVRIYRAAHPERGVV
eukprot:CAMPEP_0119529446 /NCGR_PEP_ID=MMETSP1344-20130328/43450_1 /TAXON_ID=236787 /ORGANISM="Florenciella parvula, Strain CCMP2471" /LENGTH=57 /DNA_ID=CAMNT_0007569079 /DNA_START=87 /DNA_END=257 /DNA_ORIENTATION=-